MNTRTIRSLLGCALLALLLVPLAASAADSLERIRATRTLLVGVREAAIPFSYLNEQKQPVGYTIDICRKVADALRRELKLSELKLSFQKVTTEDRFDKIASGAIDIECGSTTNLKSRQQKVAFSYSIFVSGTRLLVRKDSGISGLESLNGKRVGIVRGTTSEKIFSGLQASGAGMKLQVFAGNGEAVRALDAGKVDAFAQQEVQLAGQMGRLSHPEQFAVVGAGLSVEPVGLVVRKDDKQLLALVDKALAALFASGEINAIYDRWFNTPTLKVPMSAMTRDSLMHPSHEAGVVRVLGQSF
ncbi:amino acid ABC transporter substrate-binding protein [Niveibacterium terrae]|uniref:amino acid ABC transporter substrate-binding protein n=1 Tax=Niveibacterium terrae TaxID=3373598 RepID=UPI003A8F9A92